MLDLQVFSGEVNSFSYKYEDWEDPDSAVEASVDLGPCSVFLDYRVDESTQTVTIFLK